MDNPAKGGEDSLKLVFHPVSKPRQINVIFTINIYWWHGCVCGFRVNISVQVV